MVGFLSPTAGIRCGCLNLNLIVCTSEGATIQHEAGKVVHKLGGDRNVEMSLYVWQKAVCQFSDEVFKFFMTAWPKNINDEDDLKGFELFMSLWRQRRAAASN